ncbi:MAG: hypothetical protein IT371_09555 [Deltaproteobacteria bacterium]|nr:hypothetical protein [Deltaproteobacteria bacterium]
MLSVLAGCKASKAGPSLGQLGSLQEPAMYTQLGRLAFPHQIRPAVRAVVPALEGLDESTLLAPFELEPTSEDDMLLVVAAQGLERAGSPAAVARLETWLDAQLLAPTWWSQHAVTHTLRVLTGKPTNARYYTYGIDEMLQVLPTRTSSSTKRTAALVACQKAGSDTLRTVTFSGTDARSGQPARVELSIRQPARDFDLTRAAVVDAVARYERGDEENWGGPDGYAPITPAGWPAGMSRLSNCAGTVLRWILMKHPGLPSHESLDPFTATASDVDKLCQTFSAGSGTAAEAEVGTIIIHRASKEAADHVEVVVEVRAATRELVVWGKDNFGKLREHVVRMDDPYPASDPARRVHSYAQDYCKLKNITKVEDPDVCHAPTADGGGAARDGGVRDAAPPRRDAAQCPTYKPTVGMCAGQGGCPAGGAPCPCGPGGEFCCVEGFCWDRGPVACKQATCPARAGRTYTGDCCCNCWDDQTYVNVYDPCRPGYLLRCDPK